MEKCRWKGCKLPGVLPLPWFKDEKRPRLTNLEIQLYCPLHLPWAIIKHQAETMSLGLKVQTNTLKALSRKSNLWGRIMKTHTILCPDCGKEMKLTLNKISGVISPECENPYCCSQVDSDYYEP